MRTQIPPVGPVPEIDTLLVGALMYAPAAEVNQVLEFVHDDDLNWPIAPVLSAVRRLAEAGVRPAPQLVADELRRAGALDRRIAVALADASTSGASGCAARHYAAASVAASLRRRVESTGHALTAASAEAAEDDLSPMAVNAVARITDCAQRLAALRGGVE